jgi:hypothetical protein
VKRIPTVICCWVIAEYGCTDNKDKPVVEPQNYAVHDEGEMPGWVITISSPRCLYSDLWGWLGWCGNVRAAGLGWLSGELYTARLSGRLPFLRPVQSM